MADWVGSVLDVGVRGLRGGYEVRVTRIGRDFRGFKQKKKSEKFHNALVCLIEFVLTLRRKILRPSIFELDGILDVPDCVSGFVAERMEK